MLISFQIENFKSIREPVRLDLIPSNAIKEDDFNLIATGNKDVPYLSRVVAIYGTNGSGKSTILKGAGHMRRLILQSAKETTHGERISVEPFLLDKKSGAEPTTFTVEFIVHHVRYLYTFSTTSERIISEQLQAYPNGTKQIWFDRRWAADRGLYEWKYSVHFRGEKVSIADRTRHNTLFLSKAVQENDAQLIAINDFFQHRFFINFARHEGNHTVEPFLTPAGREKIMRFLHAADLDIDDVQMKQRELPEGMDVRWMRGWSDYDIKILHRIPGTDELIPFNLERNESAGTIKLFKLAGRIIQTLEKGGVLFIDELEHELHVQLQQFLLGLFTRSDQNPRGAQLIFTTHAPLIIEETLLRRDQIWFTAKTEEKNTVLYSLAELAKYFPNQKPFRKGQDFIRGFLESKFYPSFNFPTQLSLFDDIPDNNS